MPFRTLMQLPALGRNYGYIETLRGHRIHVTASSPRHLPCGEEKKVRLRRGEMMNQRMESRTETVNVAKVDV